MTSSTESPSSTPLEEAQRLFNEYLDLEAKAGAKLEEVKAAFAKINQPLPLFDRLDEEGR